MTERIEPESLRKMFETISLRAPENAIGFILWRLTARYQRETDRAFAPLDLTNLQFVALALVAWFEANGETVSQAELARFGGIHPMQLSLMLKALERKRFVFRERSRSDTRAKQVSITSTGLKVLRSALPLALEVQERLFGVEGRPGGALHQTLLKLDQSLAAQDRDQIPCSALPQGGRAR